MKADWDLKQSNYAAWREKEVAFHGEEYVAKSEVREKRDREQHKARMDLAKLLGWTEIIYHKYGGGTTGMPPKMRRRTDRTEVPHFSEKDEEVFPVMEELLSEANKEKASWCFELIYKEGNYTAYISIADQSFSGSSFSRPTAIAKALIAFLERNNSV
jgi:hypothetical protein